MASREGDRCVLQLLALPVLTHFQWLKDALDIWRDNYYDRSPVITANGEAGKIMYHLGHISLSVYINTLYTAVGSKSHQGLVDVS
jgi:hypothetical protein